MSGECDQCGEHTLGCNCEDDHVTVPPIKSTWFKAFDKGRMKRLILDYMRYASKSACSSIVEEQVDEQETLIEEFLNKRYGKDDD